MKLRKMTALFVLFLAFFVINGLLIYHFYRVKARELNQQRILAELEELDAEVASDLASLASGTALNSIDEQITLVDVRAAKLRAFLRKRGSPLYDLADYIVEKSDEASLDYRLYVAIAMQESGGCRTIPENSFNCTGLGIYGDNVWRFDSYEENVVATIKVLKERYVDKGLITPGDIMKVYTPASNGSWARAIRYFFHTIDNAS
ncbi:MAG: hypothetical protein ACE5DQ_01850 [Candidatus Paceibacterota bacterium]